MDPIVIVAIIPVILVVAYIVYTIRRGVEGDRRINMGEAVAGLAILMVAVLVISSVVSTSMDREYELYDCVPLASFGSNAEIEGDCAEIVTIGGVDYVRMTDLGTFKARSGDGEVEYTVTKARMDLVVLSGQSNSVYYTSPQFYDGPSPVAPGKAFYLGTEEGSGNLAGLATSSTLAASGIMDMVAPDGGVMVAQMYPAFCSSYVKETGHRVLVVNTGVGGKAISYWDDGQECELWMQSVMDRVQSIASGGSVVLTPTVALWSQGESDAAQTVAYYKEKFASLVDRLEGGEWNYSFKDVLTVLPRVPGTSIPINPAIAQTQVAEEDRTVFVASSLPPEFPRTPTEQTRDNIHYTQQVYGWLGEAFGRSAAVALGYSPVVETIVYVKPLEDVDPLPAKVTAFGTSGNPYTLTASWRQETEGSYVAALSGNPRGTAIMDGLVAEVVYYSYDPTTRTLTVSRDVTGGESWGDAEDAASLVIEEGVSSVAAGAFSGFSDLTHLSIPQSLTSVGAGAFDATFKDYTDATIGLAAGEYAGTGNGVLYLMDESIFTYSQGNNRIVGLTADAAGAVNVVLPSKHAGTAIAEINNVAFKDNTAIRRVLSLPSSTLAVVQYEAFYGCASLETLSLPDTVREIQSQAVRGCASLASFDFPASLKTIGPNSFRATALTSAILPDGTETIGGLAFQSLATLESVYLPGSMTSVSTSAFAGCTEVTSVSFGSGFNATLGADCFAAWTFYASDGTTVIDKTAASNLAGHTFRGTASALVMQS